MYYTYGFFRDYFWPQLHSLSMKSECMCSKEIKTILSRTEYQSLTDNRKFKAYGIFLDSQWLCKDSKCIFRYTYQQFIYRYKFYLRIIPIIISNRYMRSYNHIHKIFIYLFERGLIVVYFLFMIAPNNDAIKPKHVPKHIKTH